MEQGVHLVRGMRGRYTFSSTRLISPCSSTTNSNSSNIFTTTSSNSFCSTNNRSVVLTLFIYDSDTNSERSNSELLGLKHQHCTES